VVERLAPHAQGSVIRDAKLVVSELVTNSVRHSGSDEPIRLRAWARANGLLKFEVADGGHSFEPGEAGHGHEGEGGRGLMILDAVAARWGISDEAGTRVWFELAPGASDGVRAEAG